jgi:hypothetical protein
VTLIQTPPENVVTVYFLQSATKELSTQLIMPKAERRQSDVDSLREERLANAVPWSRSPFKQDTGLVVSDPDDESYELRPGELRVKAPQEVPWIGKL